MVYIAEACQVITIQQSARYLRLSTQATIDHYIMFSGHN
jgi:hypothetical protein